MSIHTATRGAAGEIETFAMKNCVMILSSQAAAAAAASGTAKTVAPDPTYMFSCKTCDRKFPSFQALGGHRASHQKIKLAFSATPEPVKMPRIHACSICGQEFLIGQALGGHMRRHRQVAAPLAAAAGGSTVTDEGSTENSDGSNCDQKKRKNDEVALTEKLISGGKRICLDFDLNFPVEKLEKEDEHEIEDGEIVGERDFLKLELRQPINC